jgi:hypothetical protein
MKARCFPRFFSGFSGAALLALAASLRADEAAPAPFPKALVQSVWVQSIWADGRHNGFPGIAQVGDYGEGPTSAISLAGGSGWGHESDVVWTPDGTMVCAIRNSGPGVVVMGKAPLGPWKAFGTDAWNFGGPALHATKGGGILLAARAMPEKAAVGFPSLCKVWTVTANGVENPWVVPCSGDGAYQSFADGPTAEEVLLANYSSHEYPQPKGVGNNPTNIYLAHLRVRHTPP